MKLFVVRYLLSGKQVSLPALTTIIWQLYSGSSQTIATGCLKGLHGYKRAVLGCFAENHRTVYQSKQGVVAAYAYVFAGVVLGATLANQYVTCNNHLASKFLNA